MTEKNLIYKGMNEGKAACLRFVHNWNRDFTTTRGREVHKVDQLVSTNSKDTMSGDDPLAGNC